MEENRSIIEGLSGKNSYWHQHNEDATLRVLCLYSKIRERFENDSTYGQNFVNDNPELIGELVKAAVIECHRLSLRDRDAR